MIALAPLAKTAIPIAAVGVLCFALVKSGERIGALKIEKRQLEEKIEVIVKQTAEANKQLNDCRKQLNRQERREERKSK